MIETYDWEMKPADWLITRTGGLKEWSTSEVVPSQRFGMRYHTEEIATRESKRMRETNIIAYWVSVLDTEWTADWEDVFQKKCYILMTDNRYILGESRVQRSIGTTYGSQNTIQKIIKALNEGEI